MKSKLLTLFVMAIFIVSIVPLAIADEDDSNNRKEKRFEIQKERLEDAKERKESGREFLVSMKEDLLEKHKGRIAELVEKCAEGTNSSVEECKERFEKRLKNLETLPEKFQLKVAEFESRKAEKEKELEDMKEDKLLGKFNKMNGFKIRNLMASDKEKARQDYIKARFNYNQAKDKLEKSKDRLDNAKKLDKACKDPESEECTEAKAELLASAKEHFMDQADMIIEMLQKLRAKIVANEDISNEDEATLTAVIDAKVSNVTAIKQKINVSANKEELLAAARELKNEWNSIKNTANKYASFLVSSRMAGVIVKSNHLETKLERILGLMAEKGQNVTEVQSLVDQFHAEINASKADFRESQSLWLKVKLDSDASVQEAQEKLKDAKEHLKKANELLQQIFKKLDKGSMKEADEEDDLEDDDEETPGNSTSTNTTNSTN